MKNIKFTVIGTSFNDAKIILNYFTSIMQQTFQPVEYILVDGGSTDNTVEMVKEFAEKENAPIRVISGQRLNIAQGYNVGIKEAKTDIIIITGLGNKYESTFFEELIKEFHKEREVYEEQITALEKELKQYRVKPEHKIQITSKNKEVLVDLFHQLQGLKHWKNGQEFLITHSQATWAKIIANYFIEGDDVIPFNTIKKYFGSGKNRHPEKIRRYTVSPKE